MLESIYKVPGGKLIKVKLEAEGSRIESIILLGDFFIHPEDTITKIEKELQGVDLIESNIIQSIKRSIEANQAQVIGADAADFAKAILLAKKSL